MQSTNDDRDLRNMRQFVTRSAGSRSLAPGNSTGSLCDCAVDSQTGSSYCVCAPMTTTDMQFAPEVWRNVTRPAPRFSSPCERAAIKRRQMAIAKSIA